MMRRINETEEKTQSRNKGHQVSSRMPLANMAQHPMTKRMLKTADPTMVPMPTSLLAMKTPKREVKSSGADPPAAMNVAPATSSDSDSFSAIISSEGTKNSSQTIAKT